MNDKNDAPESFNKELVEVHESITSDASDPENPVVLENLHGLKRQLKNRHAQMITIGQYFHSQGPSHVKMANHDKNRRRHWHWYDIPYVRWTEDR